MESNKRQTDYVVQPDSALYWKFSGQTYLSLISVTGRYSRREFDLFRYSKVIFPNRHKLNNRGLP
jgi:hypothetical protein